MARMLYQRSSRKHSGFNLSFSPCSYKVMVGKESSDTQANDLTSAETEIFSAVTDERENGKQGPSA